MTTAKIGTLLKITGQVVRTHPVHPELVSGTFMCLDCRTLIKDVEQQFKYTQVVYLLITNVLHCISSITTYSLFLKIVNDQFVEYYIEVSVYYASP